MIARRPSAERGRADHGWLDTRFTFSFADYDDPHHVQFRSLRVINEDVVAPDSGFPPHPHRDMEIITYVLSGALAHRDSTGSSGVLRAGEVQHMTAGAGVVHSEMNPSKTEPVHLLQIWILPERRGLPPLYEQKHFPEQDRRGRLRLIASPDGADRSLTIRQDASLHAAILAPGQSVTHDLAPGRHAWIQVARGALDVNGTPLAAGDGAAVSDEPRLRIAATQDTEFLLFDLA